MLKVMQVGGVRYLWGKLGQVGQYGISRIGIEFAERNLLLRVETISHRHHMSIRPLIQPRHLFSHFLKVHRENTWRRLIELPVYSV